MKGNALYTVFVTLIFLLTCVIALPSLIILGQRHQWHSAALKLTEIWAKVYFRIILIKVEIEGKHHLHSDKQYIFCANHFSYLDIPAFYLLYHAKFIGKSSLTKIPLFGYFFKKIHIPVNRSSARSRAESLKKSKEALDEGHNLMFFPEGGILVKEENLPYMMPFKDGAFKLAVEKQLPIVPVIMPYNFQLLPDKSPIRFYRTTCKVIALQPIWPKSLEEREAKRLKELTHKLIQDELLKHHPDKVQTVH